MSTSSTPASSTTQIPFPVAPPSARRGEPAWEVAHLFPPQGAWTEAEYLALDTKRMVELCDGYLEVLPMPTLYHQLLVKFLHRKLDEFVAAYAEGVVLFAPLPVRLGSGRYREPDVIYLRPNRIPSNRREQPQGADLVMEVVSEGQENRERDLLTKRAEYAASGIPEYWIVDPDLQRITVLVLENDTYREHGTYDRDAMAVSALLPGFSLSVAEVFASGEA